MNMDMELEVDVGIALSYPLHQKSWAASPVNLGQKKFASTTLTGGGGPKFRAWMNKDRKQEFNALASIPKVPRRFLRDFLNKTWRGFIGGDIIRC